MFGLAGHSMRNGSFSPQSQPISRDRKGGVGFGEFVNHQCRTLRINPLGAVAVN
jgi:hypothetical protein